MKPPPLAVEAFKSSKEVRALVVDGLKSASLLLKDGSVMRVMSMACVDSAKRNRAGATSRVTYCVSLQSRTRFERAINRIGVLMFRNTLRWMRKIQTTGKTARSWGKYVYT
jgi:hypothetical protein